MGTLETFGSGIMVGKKFTTIGVDDPIQCLYFMKCLKGIKKLFETSTVVRIVAIIITQIAWVVCA